MKRRVALNCSCCTEYIIGKFFYTLIVYIPICKSLPKIDISVRYRFFSKMMFYFFLKATPPTSFIMLTSPFVSICRVSPLFNSKQSLRAIRYWYISPTFCNVASLTALVMVNTSFQIWWYQKSTF